jgi:hypothetical protein
MKIRESVHLLFIIFPYRKTWIMAFLFETFLSQPSTTQVLNGFVFAGFSLPFALRLADRLAVHSPQ